MKEAAGRPEARVAGLQIAAAPPPRRPEWLTVRLPGGPGYARLTGLLREMDLHTVCEEARCPNIGECFSHLTATFMILGRVCTRACRFCAVETGVPRGLDPEEPARVAGAVATLGLRHVVVTSVARDELPDGGASIFAATIRAIRDRVPGCGVEVLIPDFQGDPAALRQVVEARPDILNHNVETCRRLTPRVRARARYERTLELLGRARAWSGPEMLVKSGFMVGLGESREECAEVMRDLRAAGCEVLTVGQYLRPSRGHLPVVRYYRPEEFRELRSAALDLGFRHCEAGPLVRSSYHAHEQSERVRRGHGSQVDGPSVGIGDGRTDGSGAGLAGGTGDGTGV